MRRRELLLYAAGALVPGRADAQTRAKPWRLGMLLVANDEGAANYLQSFDAGMRDFGYASGRDYVLEQRYDAGPRIDALARELAEAKPDLLLATEITSMYLRRRTQAIPIVMLISADPVRAGLVQSLARPGTNVTGMSGQLHELVEKQVELLAETVPNLARIALLTGSGLAASKDSPYYGVSDPWPQAAERAAKRRQLRLVLAQAGDRDGLVKSFERMRAERVQAVVVATNAVIIRLQDETLRHAMELQLATIAGTPQFAQAGGLMSYGPDMLWSVRYAARYVDRILKGARPADLPVEQVSRFQFIINLKIAKALGISIPQSVLLRADRVIE